MTAPRTAAELIAESNAKHADGVRDKFWSTSDDHASQRVQATIATQLSADRDRDYRTAFSLYCQRGYSNLSVAHQALIRAYDAEHRDQSVGTGSAGGFTVPPAFLPKLTVGLKVSSAMLSAANVIDTADGAPMSWPSCDDTGNVGAIVSENTAATSQDLTFGGRSLSAFMYTSRPIKVSFQLEADAFDGFESQLGLLLGRRIGRAANAHFTNGTGGGTQPTGLVPNGVVGVTGATGSTVIVSYDNLVDLVASVNAEYVSEAALALPGHVGFMMHSLTLATVRKLKDSNGEPLFESDTWPAQILGFPVIVNDDMPVMAANAKSIAFGHFGLGYIVRLARGRTAVQRLTERFADALQVGFQAYAGIDGTPDDTAAIRFYRNSAT